MIKLLNKDDTLLMADFIQNAMPTDQIANAEKLFEKIISSNSYGGFAVIENDVITNVLFFRIIKEINSAALDIIWTRKDCSFLKNKGPDLYDSFLQYLIDNKIYSYYTFSKNVRSEKFEKVFSKLVPRRNWYDCYIEENLEPNHFSKWHLHFWGLMNGTLRTYHSTIRKYVLKQEHR